MSTLVPSCLEVEVKGNVNSEESSFCLPLALETLSTCAIEHVACAGGKLWVRKTSLCSEKNEFYHGVTVANFLLVLDVFCNCHCHYSKGTAVCLVVGLKVRAVFI